MSKPHEELPLQEVQDQVAFWLGWRRITELTLNRITGMDYIRTYWQKGNEISDVHPVPAKLTGENVKLPRGWYLGSLQQTQSGTWNAVATNRWSCVTASGSTEIETRLRLMLGIIEFCKQTRTYCDLSDS